jgi:hypothetical protein
MTCDYKISLYRWTSQVDNTEAIRESGESVETTRETLDNGEDIVRPAWRHAELGGNDLTASNRVTKRRNWEPSVADPARVVGASCAYNFKYAAMRVPQSAALHPRFRLNQIGPLQGDLKMKNAQSRWNSPIGDNAEPSHGNMEGVETVWALPLAG